MANSIDHRIQSLDVSLFEKIYSQTGIEDRESLLAIQNTTRNKYAPTPYAYLEIGSHLGGSIQPYLMDPQCSQIYSIDPRPRQQPDDRCPGYIANYEHNTTERMLELLEKVDKEALPKIKCELRSNGV